MILRRGVLQLTKNFHLNEFTSSQYAARHGIDNTPLPIHIDNLRALCENVLQPLRDLLGKSIKISSGYRNNAVNTGIGGASNSQHTRGEAADISVNGMTTMELVRAIVLSGIEFDQVIEEFGAWVHVSYSVNNRGSILQAFREHGKTRYKTIEV